ncbi:MAG: efflux RND transporter periplasmic adaptor subunit [Polaromonas sp.]|nr:efflux RND transporter periplasmic adaptor subunit [Polaromonas sp.]
MSINKKTLTKSAVALLVLGLLVFGVMRALAARKAQSEALAAASTAASQSVVELAPTDVLKLQTLDVAQGLPISGTLKAVNSAVIKARVAGELQGLTVREGDFVKAGQVIARIDASEYQSRVRQSKEQAESAKAQVDVAQRQYDNNKALVDQGFISKTSLDTSLANLNAAQATYKAAVAATEVSAKSVEDTVLKAPISGQVSQRLVQPGERVGIDAKIIEIIDVSRLEIEASLSATDSIAVRVGQSAELKIEGNTQPISAQVVRINPSAQAGSRSVLAYLSIANSGSGSESKSLILRQGLFAQGTLGTTRAALLALPLSSVRTDKPAPYVQTIENSKVVHKTVEPGARGAAGGEAVVAVKGLSENAQVIRGNIGFIREGTQVKLTQMPGGQQGSAAPASAKAP